MILYNSWSQGWVTWPEEGLVSKEKKGSLLDQKKEFVGKKGDNYG